MGLNLNGNISSIYLGSSKISEVYIGSTKIFGNSYVVPPNTLRVRFSDSAYSPSTFYGTWRKISGVSTNDWEWTKNDANWFNGFGDINYKKTLPAFTIVDAGDLSSVTDMGRLFAGCINLTQDAGDILSILTSKISSIPYVSYMFAMSGVNNCSQWPSVLRNVDCTKMFASCYDLANPNYVYTQANNRGCTTTNMVALAGINSSAGRSSLISVPTASGGSSTQNLNKGFWAWQTSSSLSWVNNPNSYRLAAYMPVFSSSLSTTSYEYTAKIANTSSTSLQRVYWANFTGCFNYKGVTPSKGKQLNGATAFFQVGTNGLTWYYAFRWGKLIGDSSSYGDSIRYNYAWQPTSSGGGSYGTFDRAKDTYFSLVAMYTTDFQQLNEIPVSKFFLPCMTASNSAGAINGAFGNSFTIS